MSNLPPGVSVNDIPGNRPEDVEYEKQWEILEKTWMLEKIDLPDELYDYKDFVRAVDIARELAWSEGYLACKHDIDMEGLAHGDD